MAPTRDMCFRTWLSLGGGGCLSHPTLSLERVQHRLQELLDKQDADPALGPDEKREAEGLMDLADLLSLLRLRSERSNGGRV